jgi:hypothetical protein
MELYLRAFMVCIRKNLISKYTQNIEHYAHIYNIFRLSSGRNYDDIKCLHTFGYYSFIGNNSQIFSFKAHL